MQRRDPVRPGDQVVRRPRPGHIAPITLRVRAQRSDRFFSKPAVTLFGSLVIVILVGTLLLELPFATKDREFTSPLVAFFTATSAVTTTGLTLVSTADHYSVFGQAVIAVMIFFGGLGFMTGVTFLLVIVGHRLSLPEHLRMREALSVEPLGGLVRLLVHVFLLDVVITAAAAVALLWRFSQLHPTSEAIWQSIFHAISAFNTAGFDIVGPASLMPFASDYYVQAVVGVTGILGAISYTVLLQVFGRRRWRTYSLDTKLVLVTVSSFWLLSGGLASIYSWLHVAPHNAGEATESVASAFFHVVNAGTSMGFATVDLSVAAEPVLLILTAAMFVGGAAGSTAGGIKVNTIAVILTAVWSSLTGKDRPTAFGRHLDTDQVGRALAILTVGIAIAIAGTFAILLTDPALSVIKTAFEAVSALGTVGLTSGVLASLSLPGTWIIIALMLIGRLGIFSLIVVLAPREQTDTHSFPVESVKIG